MKLFLKENLCSSCGCDPCDCGWGTNELKRQQMFLWKSLKNKIIKNGGFVNAHAHFGRAYTLTPVDELLEHGLTVVLGTDNINDVYKSHSDGNMMTELRFLMETLHIYDQETLVKIVTENGRKVM